MTDQAETRTETRADRLNQYIAGIRKRVKAMDDGGDLAARTPTEWLHVAERMASTIAADASDAELRERALTCVAAIFLATDSEAS